MSSPRPAPSGPVYSGSELGFVTITTVDLRRDVEVQSIAQDQTPFAVRLRPWRSEPVPGLRFRARTIDLAGGFSNSFELDVDVTRVDVCAVSSAPGFHLRDLLTGVRPQCRPALAAVSGSFSFISDDPGYAPAEPCLDFCCRESLVVSLPTADKPALLVLDGRPVLRPLAARGTLTVDRRQFEWLGSKLAPAGTPPRLDQMLVYGASNCTIRYRPHPRTGFLRYVDRRANRTPRDPDVVDLVVARSGDRHVVADVRVGGGADLFDGSWVLRTTAALPDLTDGIGIGSVVGVTSVDDVDCRRLTSGWSIGPSAADAAAGAHTGYDESLGTSPFGDGVRFPRTMVGFWDGRLLLRVLDGAPLAPGFSGVSAQEAADLLDADGIPATHVYHLDGGQSSKVALLEDGRTTLLGSMHYLRWPQSPGDPFRWRGHAGRLLRSAIAIGSAS